MPILAAIVAVISIILFVKNKNLTRLLTMATLFKSAKSAPIGYTIPEVIDITTESVILLIVISAFCYGVLKYFKFSQRVKKYITLPCNSCLVMTDSPQMEILFYVENILGILYDLCRFAKFFTII